MPTDHRLASLAEVRSELRVPTPESANAQDDWLGRLLDRVSAQARVSFDRYFLRAAVVETHTFDGAQDVVYLAEWPIVAGSLHIFEDTNRGYGADTELVAGTDYIADERTGRIMRVAGSVPWPFQPGVAAVKFVYSSGYDDALNTKANIDGALRNAIVQAVVANYRAAEARHRNEKVQGDKSGNKIASSPLVTLPVALDAATFVGPFARVSPPYSRTSLTITPAA